MNSGLNGKMTTGRNVITLTDAAAERVRYLLAQREGEPAAALRIGVDSRGCSGMAYTVEYVDEVGPGDEVVEDKGVKVIVDPMAVMFILGTELDYVEDKMQPGFRFNNPNEKSRCGCGESFTI
jgi:iron-sulfur cluster assembly protein